MRWGLSAKKREDLSYFRGSYSDRPARAAEPGQPADSYLAPAPCRTQGVRGAADTPPATLDSAALTSTGPRLPAPRDYRQKNISTDSKPEWKSLAKEKCCSIVI